MKQTRKNKKYSSIKKRGRSGSSSGWLVIFILGGILFVIAALFAIRNQSSAGPKVPVAVNGRPALKVNQEKVDLGDMKFNALAEVTFTVSNEGDETLRFSKEPFIEVLEGC